MAPVVLIYCSYKPGNKSLETNKSKDIYSIATIGLMEETLLSLVDLTTYADYDKIMNNFLPEYSYKELFEDTKGLIRSRKSKDRK